MGTDFGSVQIGIGKVLSKSPLCKQKRQ